MLKNDYLDAKIGLDTEENEPSKVCRYQPTTPPERSELYRSADVGAAAGEEEVQRRVCLLVGEPARQRLHR